jgi:hypothetical protein
LLKWALIIEINAHPRKTSIAGYRDDASARPASVTGRQDIGRQVTFIVGHPAHFAPH